MAELNKIKAEKARDEAEKEAGRREEEEQIRMENILSGKSIFENFWEHLSQITYCREPSFEGEEFRHWQD